MADGYRQSVIISIALILGSFIFAGGALVWLTRDMKIQTDEVLRTRREILQSTRSVELLAQFKAIAPQITTYEQRINLLLPQRDGLLEFPKWIDGIARVNMVASNFTFQGGTVASEGDKPGYTGFTLDVSGSYEDLKNFLRELEITSSKFLVDFDAFDFRESGGGYRVIAQGRVFFK